MLGYIRHSFSVVWHKILVMYYIAKFCTKMLWRGIIHDRSKFALDEGLGFGKVTHKLRGTTYGTPAYQDLLNEMNQFISLHYARNSHHPEFYKDGINEMSVEDFVEMFCDWQAAVKKHKDGNINRSIVINKDRFKMNKQLSLLMMNTVGSPEEYRTKLSEIEVGDTVRVKTTMFNGLDLSKVTHYKKDEKYVVESIRNYFSQDPIDGVRTACLEHKIGLPCCCLEVVRKNESLPFPVENNV